MGEDPDSTARDMEAQARGRILFRPRGFRSLTSVPHSFLDFIPERVPLYDCI